MRKIIGFVSCETRYEARIERQNVGNSKLREIRTGLGLSQLQLSFLSRVPNCVISDFERGIRQPWPKAKRLLAEALRRPVNEVFPDNGHTERGPN